MADYLEGLVNSYLLYRVKRYDIKRELRGLASLKDNNPKTMLTLDEGPDVNHNGIIQRSALAWLLERP